MNSNMNPNMKWLRAKDGAICGVCKGLARTLDLPVGIFRLFWLLSVLCLGAGLGLYILLAICLPREDKQAEALEPRVLGVCSRISKRIDMEVGIVRVLAILLLVASLGATIVGYIVLYFVLDDQSRSSSDNKPATPPVMM